MKFTSFEIETEKDKEGERTLAEEKQVDPESLDMIIIITDSVSKRISSKTVSSGGLN